MHKQPCIANKVTGTRGNKQQPIGYKRKVHKFNGGDFCVNCGKARR